MYQACSSRSRRPAVKQESTQRCVELFCDMRTQPFTASSGRLRERFHAFCVLFGFGYPGTADFVRGAVLPICFAYKQFCVLWPLPWLSPIRPGLHSQPLIHRHRGTFTATFRASQAQKITSVAICCAAVVRLASLIPSARQGSAGQRRSTRSSLKQ